MSLGYVYRVCSVHVVCVCVYGVCSVHVVSVVVGVGMWCVVRTVFAVRIHVVCVYGVCRVVECGCSVVCVCSVLYGVVWYQFV